jgi:hypothetical protein
MKKLLVFALTIILFTSCKQSAIDYASKWSSDIKSKIFEDVNIPVDSISIDTSKGNLKEVSLFNKGIRTKQFRINTSTSDTVVSIF